MQARAMEKHEKFCTMNPNRKCRVCALVNGGYGCDLNDLLALLPDPTEYNELQGLDVNNVQEKLVNEIKDCLPKLEEAADNCPACMLAAFRQKKIYLNLVEGFDYQAEMKEVFSIANSERTESAGYYQ